MVAPEYLSEGNKEFSDYLVDHSGMASFDWDKPVALYPVQRDARLHAQRGFFTIHGEDIRPLDKIAPSCLKKVTLPREAWEDARLFLRDAGIDEFLMFPDLDGLARHLHEKHDVRSGAVRRPIAAEGERQAAKTPKLTRRR